MLNVNSIEMAAEKMAAERGLGFEAALEAVTAASIERAEAREAQRAEARLRDEAAANIGRRMVLAAAAAKRHQAAWTSFSGTRGVAPQ